jgi:guanylate kinase
MTTREPRLGEVEGTDYFFVESHFFRMCIDKEELVEWTKYNGHLYGLLIRHVMNIVGSGRNAIFCCDPSGAKKAREKFLPDRVFSIYLEVDRELAKARMLSRGDTINSVETRLASDDSIFKFDPLLYDLVIMSGELKQDISTAARMLTW